MESIDNYDDYVTVIVNGGQEEADISNTDYILLMSDDARFYYNPKIRQNKAKNLKVILRSCCKDLGIINFDNKTMCKECYEKNKDYPRISLLIGE
jgi:hypothetical protein